MRGVTLTADNMKDMIKPGAMIARRDANGRVHEFVVDKHGHIIPQPIMNRKQRRARDAQRRSPK